MTLLLTQNGGTTERKKSKLHIPHSTSNTCSTTCINPVTLFSIYICQARRQGGFEGVRANPPFDQTVPFESGPLVSLLLSLRITAVQAGLVAATVCEFFHGGPARNARVSCLCCCDERTRVI